MEYVLKKLRTIGAAAIFSNYCCAQERIAEEEMEQRTVNKSFEEFCCNTHKLSSNNKKSSKYTNKFKLIYRTRS